MNGAVAIEAHRLGKYFFDKKSVAPVKAVDGVTFSVRGGEIFGLLGPNGAGKTTTIRVLAGLLRPTFGEARVLGHDVAKEPNEVRSSVGFLTENHGNYETLTLRQNLTFFAKFYSTNSSGVDARVDEVLEELELARWANWKVGKLSKGLKQRGALARVLVHDPRVLFLDEPTAGLDPAAAVRVRNLVVGLKSMDRAVFVNSHNLAEVQKICDRVAIIDHGKLLRVGTPAELGSQVWKETELSCHLVAPAPPALVRRLESLEGVADILVDADGRWLRLLVDDYEEVTPRVVQNLVEGGARVLEVAPKTHELEEVYLKLVRERGGEVEE
ncbi:MAG: ABC transporter ATP-binding protein [Promethearchaeota archaeon]